MKKIFSILFIAGTVLLASCAKELQQVPLSTATTVTFYQQPSDFIQAINAVYNSLRNYPSRLMFLSEIRSDNIYPTNTVGRDPDPINNFAPGIASNTYVEEAWTADFNGIFKANVVIEQVAKNAAFVGSAALANRLTAEAKFLRAFFYFDLVRYYGKVPVIDHVVSDAEARTIKRGTVAEVYALIIADLQFAVANLPANYSGTFPSYSATDVGRATKYAAEAVLAQVYMARSGPNYGIEGPGLGLNEWNQAATLLTDIIGSGAYTFNPNFANIFSYTNQNPTTNKESVFSIMFLTGLNPVLGTDFPWQLVPNSYFSSLPTGNTPANGALGVPSVSTNLVNAYATNDARKSPTIHTTAFTFTGTTDANPFFRKYLDTTKIPASRFDWGINFIAVRYTDVLLLKAECVLNGAAGNQATDVDAVANQVRSRAGLLPIAGVTKAQLLDERRREFAAEGSRWFDLQRSGNLVTIMNAWIATEDAALKKMNQATANSVIYPVPQSQMDAAPGLYTQNPGYQ
ncbi:RagB/SusD family nutrient uptake outer membrane protein [Sediminibacterium roseum]|uniref:RagB/SusD family nutrient uptake outer membrane protein n=1 Tax=Sediminibacterium roseum TaxID=1978412 RepID=A0ABW9ZRX0_9BACT|nr:RagB/SusD family nutrient uptake outer membrane protein [Sediminibacterium roseum]NCI49704.1 RagB/SusD family nutrient uptake outer membrane protein [Sediminibacterium roseum]